MKTTFWILLAIAVIGGLNWALYGLIGFDAVELLFGTYTPAARIAYTIVGLASLALVAVSSMNVVVTNTNPQTKPQRAPRVKRAPRISRKARAAKAAA